MTVTLCEVGPRDGLQNEARSLAPAVRAELVDRLAATGLRWIEAASFVNPKLVPQMAGAEEVVAGLARREGTRYAGLALNERGFERLAAAGLDQVNYAVAATDEFGLRNANSDVAAATASALRVLGLAREAGIGSRITISVAFGCPFAGAVDPDRVLELGRTFAETGADEIVYADTIGVGVPRQVSTLAGGSAGLGARIGMHFHNTRNTGFANAFAALEAGVELLDASVGGTGGCPFAPKATGNVATEDLVYLLEGEGVPTGVDLDALIEVANWLESALDHRLPGQLHSAGPFAPIAG
jgi:isopropylmalate/homocitrate/citramalate synthase